MTAPTASGTALLVLDMISDYRYPGGDAVLGAASRIAPAIASLKHRMRKLGIPTIYVNDTRGRWESEPASSALCSCRAVLTSARAHCCTGRCVTHAEPTRH